jgi:hypothetical protein
LVQLIYFDLHSLFLHNMTPILVQQVIEDDGVEENQEDAVEVEAEGSTDGVLVNGNSSEEQWGMKNEEPSA